MYFCQTLGQKKLQEIADQFGVTHYATVSVTIARLRRELDADHRLAKQVATAEEWLRNY